MKRLAAITLCAATAFAGTASIVTSFISPCNPGDVYGIDYYDGSLYHAGGATSGYIYRTTTDGSTISSFKHRASGIDRTWSEFWTSFYSARLIYRLSTTGTVIRTIEAPGLGPGVAYGEGFLWYSTGSEIYKLLVDGSIVESFKTPKVGATGVCWDDPNLWLAVYPAGTIYKITQTGSIIGSTQTKGNPYGVSWDGSYLWYTAIGWVYKAKVNFTSIAPASLGRVKALYR